MIRESESIQQINESWKKKLIAAELHHNYSEIQELKAIHTNLQDKFTDILDRYHSLYNDSIDLHRTIDTNGIIIECNKSYAENLGYTKNEIIGHSIFEHVKKENIVALQNSFTKWKKDGKVKDVEIWFKRKDGSTFLGLLSANTLYDKEGNIIGSNSVIRDITEIYNARIILEEKQKQILAQRDQLQKLDVARNEFLAMITHELKTPLVPIKGYLDLLLSEYLGPLNNAQKQRLEIILSSTQSLLRLITDLLDAQKLEIDQIKLDCKKCNISEIIHESIAKLQADADRYGISITTELQDKMLSNCDKGRIIQVLTNLLSNSLDFCPQKTGKINIKLFSVDSNIKITIKDNGIGMMPDELDKIFVKFYQVNTTSTREHGGTGLGLVICKGIIEAHGGKIWVESEGRNKGIETYILLPRLMEDLRD